MTITQRAHTPRTRLLAIAAVAILMLMLVGSARAAAPGDLDTAFNPNVTGTVYAVALQPDGKILIGGTFSAVGGQQRDRVARLNADGTLDTGFSPTPNNAVRAITLQPDGKILIGGAFTTVNGQNRSKVARLNTDGTLDAGFNGPSVGATVFSLAVQATGDVLVGGNFSSVAGTNRANLARLSSTGVFDSGFDADLAGGGGIVNTVVVVADGKILVGGDFTTVAGQNRDYFARLNAGGALDATLNASIDSAVSAIAVQADGAIVVGGQFSAAGGETRDKLARLTSNGALDTGFANPSVGGDVTSLAAQADGKVVIGGVFTSVGGQTRNRVARVNSDGTLDTAFANPAVTGGNQGVRSTVLQPDGKILVAGDFTSVGGQTRNNMGRLQGAGPQVAPAGVTATAGNAQATVSWGAVDVATSYTVTSSPGGRTCTASAPSTSCTVTGLTNGTSYTFTVAAANELGAGPASAPSNAVTPTEPGGAAAVGSARLTATLLPQRRRLVSGQQMRIGIRTANAGTGTASSASACIRLPANLVVVKAGEATRSGPTLCFRLGDVVAGGTASRVLTVRAVAVRRVTRTVGGTARATGLARVSAPRAAVTIVPRAVRAPVTG